jgi:PAS domain S-box-containing protein
MSLVTHLGGPDNPTISRGTTLSGLDKVVIESIGDAIIVVDGTGRVLMANPATAAILGRAPGDLVGQAITTIIPERLRPDHEAGFNGFVATGEAEILGVPVRVPTRLPDGSEVIIELVITAVSDPMAPGSPVAVASIRRPADPDPDPDPDPEPDLDLDLHSQTNESAGAAHDEPDRHLHIAEQLLDILAEGSSGREVETRLLARLGQSLGWEVTALWRLDAATGQLRDPTLWRENEASFVNFCAASYATAMADGEGLPGRVLQRGHPIWIADLARDQQFRRSGAAATDGLRSAFAFPVEAKGRRLGVIEMLSVEPRPPDHDLVEVMATVGRHLGDFLAQAAETRERERLLTELEQARRSREFLLRASRVLAEAADFRETLERLATMAVPILGDLCLIDILAEDGTLQRVVARHADPEKQHLAAQLQDRFPPDPDGPHPSVEVIRTGRSLWSEHMTADFLRATTRDEEHLAVVRDLGFTSYMSVPLTASGRVLGSVTLVAAGSGRHFAENDLALAEELAQQVAAVIARAWVYDLEHEVARTLQGSLLPDRLPWLPGLTVAARYLPSTAGAKVGGDWYDVIPVAPGWVGLAVGDVVGHDVVAATVMGQLRNALRAYALDDHDPEAVLRKLAEFTERLDLERLATVVYGVLEVATGILTVASAGHPPPLVIPAVADPWFVDVQPGPLLGIGPLEYPSRPVVLGPKDLVVLYTDGLVEDRTNDIRLGMDRLLALATPVARDAEVVCQALMRHQEAGGGRSDDVAILAVQREAPPRR